MQIKLRCILVGGLALLVAANFLPTLRQAWETSHSEASLKSLASINTAIGQKPHPSESQRQSVAPLSYLSTEIDNFSESADFTYEPSVTTPDSAVPEIANFLDADDVESLAELSDDETIPMDTGPFVDADDAESLAEPSNDETIPMDTGPFVYADDNEGLEELSDDETIPMNTGPFLDADIP